MIPELRQRFCNPQLNSLSPFELAANGSRVRALPLNTKGDLASPREAILNGDQCLIIDCGMLLLYYDLNRETLLGYTQKDENSFVTISDDYILTCRSVLKKLSFGQDASEGEGFFVPGFGPYSTLELLIPFEQNFLAGTQNNGNPKNPDNVSFSLTMREYPGSRSNWKKEYPGFIPPPPVSRKGNVAFLLPNVIKLVDMKGSETTLYKNVFTPIAASYGPDGILYVSIKSNRGSSLLALSPDNGVVWEASVNIHLSQYPPVVSPSGTVLLVGESEIECFSSGNAIWSQPVGIMPDRRPRIICAANSVFVIIKGPRLSVFDQEGKELWSHLLDPPEDFLTGPIIDKNGRILLVTQKHIVVYE